MQGIVYNGQVLRISPKNEHIEETTDGAHWIFVDYNQTCFGRINELYVWKGMILGLTNDFLIKSTNGYSWTEVIRISHTNCGHFTKLSVKGDELSVLKDGIIWYSKDGINWLKK